MKFWKLWTFKKGIMQYVLLSQITNKWNTNLSSDSKRWCQDLWFHEFCFRVINLMTFQSFWPKNIIHDPNFLPTFIRYYWYKDVFIYFRSMLIQRVHIQCLTSWGRSWPWQVVTSIWCPSYSTCSFSLVS